MSEQNALPLVVDPPEMAPEPETAAKPEKPKRITAEEFVVAWNDTVAGVATFTERSKPNSSVKKVEVGGKVPQTKQGVAALLNMQYNAVIGREKTYRKKGVTLDEMPAATRGASLDVDALNASIAERKAALAAQAD